MALLLEVQGGSVTLEYVNHLPCDNVPLSLGSVEISVHHVFSDAGATKHQCPDSTWVSLNMDMNMIRFSKDSELKHSRICFLMSRVEAPGGTGQMNFHFSGCQIQLFDKSTSVPHILLFCCPIIGWIRDSNTHCRI